MICSACKQPMTLDLDEGAYICEKDSRKYYVDTVEDELYE